MLFDDPLEAAIFSVLIELMKELEREELAKRERALTGAVLSG
jgi:hypothetical protein